MSINKTKNKFVIDNGIDPDGRKWRIVFCQNPACGKPGKIYAFKNIWRGGYKYAHDECRKENRRIIVKKAMRKMRELRYDRMHGKQVLDFPYFNIPQCPDILKKEIPEDELIPAPIKKKRTCLRCEKLFNSEGIHNRMCPKCCTNLEKCKVFKSIFRGWI